jgi:hypothetical protein
MGCCSLGSMTVAFCVGYVGALSHKEELQKVGRHERY